MSGFYRRNVIATLNGVNERNKLTVKRNHLRSSTELFDLPSDQFRELFRLPVEICHDLIAEVAPFMKSKLRNTRLYKALRVLIALRFFAQGKIKRLKINQLNL